MAYRAFSFLSRFVFLRPSYEDRRAVIGRLWPLPLRLRIAISVVGFRLAASPAASLSRRAVFGENEGGRRSSGDGRRASRACCFTLAAEAFAIGEPLSVLRKWDDRPKAPRATGGCARQLTTAVVAG